MKDKEIEKIRREVIEAQNGDFYTQTDALKKIVDKLGLSGAFKDSDNQQRYIIKMVEKIHTHLQTETMINTVRVAKWSCFWAAVAATISLMAVLIS